MKVYITMLLFLASCSVSCGPDLASCECLEWEHRTCAAQAFYGAPMQVGYGFTTATEQCVEWVAGAEAYYWKGTNGCWRVVAIEIGAAPTRIHAQLRCDIDVGDAL